MDREKSFDLDHLAAAVGGDSALMRRFALDFQTNARLYVEELRTIHDQTDPSAAAAWTAAAHKLKGAARTVGAMRLGALCERAQAPDGGADESGSRDELTAIEAELAVIEDHIARWLAAGATT